MAVADAHVADGSEKTGHVLTQSTTPVEKDPNASQVEDAHHDADGNLIYSEVDVEPEIHWRTWVALIAVWLVNFTYSQTTAGPPALLSFIAADLNSGAMASWILTSASISNAVLSPILSVASDTFQARKEILVGCCIIAFIGAAIAPGSQSTWRLIFAMTLQGVGVALCSVVYTIPAEILPRRWRPMAQAVLLAGAAASCMVAPLSLGGMIKAYGQSGWRKWFWYQTALWGSATICLIVGYRPPKRQTRYDHLSIRKKLMTLDLIGFFLFTAGLTLLISGISLGAGEFPWGSVYTVAPLVVGIACLAALGVWEWKGTSTGMIPHAMFGAGDHSGRRFVFGCLLICFEGILLFAITVFVPIQSQVLFTGDPVLIVARQVPFYTAAFIAANLNGYISTRLRTIRWPLMFGYLMFVVGIGAMISVRPGQGLNALIFNAIAGLGLGAPLALVFTAVQLAVPHSVLATATALVASARAIGISVFTAIFTVALNESMASKRANRLPPAAEAAGVPPAVIPEFITAIVSGNSSVTTIPGVTTQMISAGVLASQNATADALQIVFAIAVPFGVIAIPMSYYLGSYRKTMNYIVEAPIEELHSKQPAGK
ncbi:putative transporter [Cyphellophora attinorum]|uniref:Putative transporter n=1 Tax=Cyphellophora attinorum TaxID=1664694 RepID=A0A0N1GWX1_9EURO|nr:putative transporter [Phialophora attinorum]KPI34535.1 putative transporter [Phialophora attinorum]